MSVFSWSHIMSSVLVDKTRFEDVGRSCSSWLSIYLFPTAVAMEEQETVIGEVIAQFYSFFGGLMNLKERLTGSPGISQSVKKDLLQQLAVLEGEWWCLFPGG